MTAERCAAQLLCGDRAGSAEEVARRLLAIQPRTRGARGLRSGPRSAGLSASDVDSALARRSMVVSWLNRGTLHLVRAQGPKSRSVRRAQAMLASGSTHKKLPERPGDFTRV